MGSLVALPILVTRIRADYFVRDEDAPSPFRSGQPALSILLRILKNVAGTIFVAAGFAMLVLPGQGVITILIGISFLDLPRKRALEAWIVGRPGIRQAVQALRRRAGRPPLEMPGGGAAREGPADGPSESASSGASSPSPSPRES